MNPQTFDEYWAGYLTGHAALATRLLHYLGLFIGPVIGIALSIFVAWWAFFVVAPIAYVIALVTHPLLEGNSNKEFAGRPWWSMVAFFRMLWLEVSGGLSREMRRIKPAIANG